MGLKETNHDICIACEISLNLGIGQQDRKFRSMSVSEQLPTYPSPNPTLTLSCCQLTVVGLGEGWVGSCPDTDIDPKIQ